MHTAKGKKLENKKVVAASSEGKQIISPAIQPYVMNEHERAFAEEILE
jgi:hypothetical protein